MLEVKLESHILRNWGWESADRADPGVGGLFSRRVICIRGVPTVLAGASWQRDGASVVAPAREIGGVGLGKLDWCARKPGVNDCLPQDILVHEVQLHEHCGIAVEV